MGFSRVRLAMVWGLAAGCAPGIIGETFDADRTEPDAGAPCNATSNQAPAAPGIEEPTAGRIDVIADELVIGASAFSDADGDAHRESAFEIWSVNGGARIERVWHAEVSDPAKLVRVTLADGTLEGSGAAGLRDWTSYVVRARYRDSSESCTEWSEWSADRQFKTDDGSTYLFDPSLVHTFYLDIPPESWGPIDAEAIPPGCVPHQRSYYRGALTFEGQVLDGVGVHVKGGCGSARNLSGKAAFKINIEWDDPAIPGCPDGRRLLGQKRFTFNNNVQDGSFLHERVGYTIYRNLGIPAPRSASIQLYVNGELWGVYTHVETIDRRFLERWFGSKDGMLYEGTYWCDLISSNVPPGTDDSYCLTREFKPDVCSMPDPGSDPMDYELLRQLVQQIEGLPDGGYYPEVESFFEFDRFLTTWAIESLISHWDAYEFSIMNNYRVYHDPTTGRWTLISTGIDQTFNGDQDPWGVSGILAWRCLAEPDCEAAFAARLSQVSNDFQNMALGPLAQSYYTQIRSLVYADPRKEIDNGSFDWAVSETVNYINSRPSRIREHLAAHGF